MAELSSWSVSREIATELPEQVRLTSGVSGARGSVEVAAPADAGPGHWSPWRRPRRLIGEAAEVVAEVDGEAATVLVGRVTDASADADGVTLALELADHWARLRREVELPAFTARIADGFHPGFDAIWLVEHVLRQVGPDGEAHTPLPQTGPEPLIVASLAGSAMPSTGSYHGTPRPSDGPPLFEDRQDMPLPAMVGDSTVEWMVRDEPGEEDPVAESWPDDLTVGFLVGAPEGGNEGTVRLTFRFGGEGSGRLVAELSHDGASTSLRVAVMGTAPDVAQTDFDATTTRSWRDAGTQLSTPQWRDQTHVYQGEWDGFGDHKGLIWYDTAAIQTALAGRDVERVRVFLERLSSGGASAAQGIHAWTHDFSPEGGDGSTGTEPSMSDSAGKIGALGWGQSGWFDLPVLYGERLRDGERSGIGFFRSQREPYVILESVGGNPAMGRLRITHAGPGDPDVESEVVFQDVDLGLTWLSLRRDGDTVDVRVFQSGETVGEGTLPFWTSDPNLELVRAECDGPIPLAGVQVLAWAPDTADDLPGWEPDAYSAMDRPTAGVDGVPPLGRVDAGDVLRGLAEAEQAGVWFGEDGRLVWRSRDSMRGIDVEPVEVTSRESLVGFRWAMRSEQLARSVEAQATPLEAQRHVPLRDVWSADEAYVIPANRTLELVVGLGESAGQLNRNMAHTTETGSRYRANTMPDGSGEEVGGITGAGWGEPGRRVRLLSPTLAHIELRNATGRAVYLVDTNGDPYLHVGARLTVTQQDAVTVRRETGVDTPSALSVGDSPWRQSVEATRDLVSFLAAETSVTRPVTERVEIVPRLDVTLGTVVRLRDPDVSGLSVRGLVRDVALSGSPGSLTQFLEVQPLRPTLGDHDDLMTARATVSGTAVPMTLGEHDADHDGALLQEHDEHPLHELPTLIAALAEIDAAWAGRTLGDVDSAWSGLTLSDVDAGPLRTG